MGSDSGDHAKTDITKSKPYVLSDLLIKAISAVAIVVLGIAGWRLQRGEQASRRTEDDRRLKMEMRERAERIYLPTLRSITEVDLVLAETSADFNWPTHSDSEVVQESRLGGHLAYLGSSLFFPDGEPWIEVVTAEQNADGVTSPTPVKLHVRAAVLMLAELMRLAPFLKRMDHKDISVRVANGELRFENERGDEIEALSLDRRAIPAWNLWLPRTGIPLHRLIYDVDIDTLADDLHAQLGAIAEDIINKNAEVLSPEYVKIRDEVLRSRDQLMPRR
jgi:hypothetical protein